MIINAYLISMSVIAYLLLLNYVSIRAMPSEVVSGRKQLVLAWKVCFSFPPCEILNIACADQVTVIAALS